MIKIHIDGASAGQPGPSGAGIFVNTGSGDPFRYRIPIRSASNHEAEFIALIEALKLCIKNDWRTISILTDSKLVDESFDKRYTKRKEFASLLEESLHLADQLDLCFIKWIPSTKNRDADQLAKEALQLAKSTKSDS